MTVAFDTLRAARRLRDEAGFDERQAGVLVDTFAEGMTETLATKSDVDSLRSDLGKTETKLQGQMRELEQRMTIRLGAMMVGAVALIVALIKLV